MNQPMSLERMVATWMADAAASTAPSEQQTVDQIITATAQQRPRPRWLALLQEPPMQAQSRVLVGSPSRRLAFTAILLLIAAIAVAGIGAYLLQQPRPAASNDWPGFRGDASHSGLGARGPVGNPVVAWKATVGGPIQSNISILNGTAFVPSDDGALTAFDVASGAKRWSFNAAAPMGGPFAVDGRIYAFDGDGIAHALQATDGKHLWASTVPVVGASQFVLADGRLYVGSPDGAIVAIDANSGAQTWRTAVSPTPISMRSPAADDGVVAAVAEDGSVTGLDAATGAIRWTKDVTDDSPGSPVLAGGTVYVGASGDAQKGRLVALAASDGTERWRVEQNVYSPSVYGSLGYTGSPVGTVMALDLAHGTPLWTAQFAADALRAPAVTESFVYVGVDGGNRVVALDRATGGQLWSFDLDGSNQCCMAISNGTVVVGTERGSVYALGGDGTTLTAGAVPNVAANASAVPPPATSVPDLQVSVDWVATSGAGDFVPWGLAKAPDGKLWAAEGLSHRFAIFSPDGKFIETWGSSGTGNGQFNLRRANGDPFGMIAFGPDGSFFVIDVGNHRVQAFDKDRTFIRAWGSLGTKPGQFSEPGGAAVDADGNLSVVDNVRGVIETFRPDGTIVSTMPGFPEELGARVGVNGGANQMNIGPNGHFFLSVVEPSVVAEVDRDGKLVRTFGAPGEPGALSEQPNGVAFDADGRMYLSQGPGRGDAPGVLVFGPDGSYLGGFGHAGTGDTDLGFPWGIVVDESGIYVSDASGIPDIGLRSAIRKFEPIAFSN